MLLPIARVAAAALVGSVTYQTGRNVYETIQVVSSPPPSTASSSSSLSSLSQQSPPPTPQKQPIPQSVSELQKLSRLDIIDLYLSSCTAVPSDLTTLEGEWSGTLLRNNGLTRVTKFITNRLFGWGRRWNGKSFDAVTTTATSGSSDDSDDDDRLTGTGWNQFDVLRHFRTPTRNNNINRRRRTTKTSTSSSSTTVVLKTEREHVFDYQMEPSRLHPHDLSICLTYQNHQGKLSLWKGMKDELRVLPTTTNSISSPTTTADDENNSWNRPKYDILIGLGSLSWSGGIYNCSPFCLYRRRK